MRRKSIPIGVSDHIICEFSDGSEPNLHTHVAPQDMPQKIFEVTSSSLQIDEGGVVSLDAIQYHVVINSRHHHH